MAKLSKRIKEARSKIDQQKTYQAEEAIKLVKETSTVKFDAAIEAHIKLGIDPKKGDQIVRDAIVLPHGTGKQVKIAAIVPADRVKEAKDAGADIVGGEDLIEDIKKSGKTNFDVVVTVPEMMKQLAVVARVLGQKGLMPNPKTGTIDKDLKKMIGELKAGKVSYKNDDTANIHLSIGKASFTEQQLLENFQTFLSSIKKNKPQTVKGNYIKSIHLTSSMGPSVRLVIS